MYTTRPYRLEIKLPAFIISAVVRVDLLALFPDSFTAGEITLTSMWILGWFYSEPVWKLVKKTDQTYPCPATNRNLVVKSAHDHITDWTNQIAVCWKAQHFVCDFVKLNALGNMLERRVEKVICGSTDWNKNPKSLRFCTHQRYWNRTISVYRKIISVFFFHTVCRQWLCWRSCFLGGR
jgi:hypothetical protein